MTIDKSTIRHLVQADRDLAPVEESVLEHLVTVFSHSTKKRLEQMGKEIRSENFKVAGQLAHVIKASSINLGVIEVAQLCQKIEDAAQLSYPFDYEKTYNLIVKEYSEAVDELNTLTHHYRH